MDYFCYLILRMFGWSFFGDKLKVEKCVLVAAPHTTNWDFPLMLLFGRLLQLKYFWLGKHTLFGGFMGPMMRSLGGIPVDRAKKNDYVFSLSEEIRKQAKCILIIPPEGTRSYTNYWKTGFIQIAKSASIPIILAKLDYSKKSLEFSVPIHSGLSRAQIMQKAREFYKGVVPLRPKNFGPVQLKSEA